MNSSSIWKCGALKVANFQERRVFGGGILGRTGAELCAGAQPIKMPETGMGKTAMKLYPNPANYWVLLESNLEDDFEAQVQILDVSGKLVKSTTQMFFANEPSLLDLTNLYAGYYTVKVLNAGKPVFTEKLVITR